MNTQHFHSERGCLSYIVFEPLSREAVLIDPSAEIGVSTYVDFLESHNLVLKYIFETHTHADHISCSKEMREKTGALIARHKNAPSQTKDLSLIGNEELLIGVEKMRVLATPGHTNESISLYFGNEVFTGDALLIGGTGRTDFQLGDSTSLYQSIHSVIENLPSETIVRPGHDYRGRTQVVLQDELHTNPRVLMCETEFVKMMDEYSPKTPELFDRAIKENSR